MAQGFINHLLRHLHSSTRIEISLVHLGLGSRLVISPRSTIVPVTIPFRYHLLLWNLLLYSHSDLVYKIARTPRSVAFPTVHDRGLGYSNSFTLCRGGALSPHQIGHRRGSSLVLPDDNTSNVGTLIKNFHYVHANKKVPLQLGGFPPAPFDPSLRHQTATARDLIIATGSNLIHTVYAPSSWRHSVRGP